MTRHRGAYPGPAAASRVERAVRHRPGRHLQLDAVPDRAKSDIGRQSVCAGGHHRGVRMLGNGADWAAGRTGRREHASRPDGCMRSGRPSSRLTSPTRRPPPPASWPAGAGDRASGESSYPGGLRGCRAAVAAPDPRAARRSGRARPSGHCRCGWPYSSASSQPTSRATAGTRPRDGWPPSGPGRPPRKPRIRSWKASPLWRGCRRRPDAGHMRGGTC